jgi:cytochrome c-type biogenesis protein
MIGLALVLALGWLVVVKTQGRSALVETAQVRSTQVTDLTATLTRSGFASEGTEVEVILATPAFFRLTDRLQEAASLEADRFVVFVANESVHFGDLPQRFAPILRLDGQTLYVPAEVRVLTDSVHHRTNVVIFRDLPVALLDGSHSLELLLPQADGGSRAALAWDTPIDYPTSVRGGQGLSLGLLVSLAAGLLAAISPCLLQLTAFYLPTLAGVSMDAVQGGLPPTASRQRVMATALLFILGFTIPYTIGGALMGGLGQTLAASGWLSPTGPVTTVAGLVMIGMAGLVAHRSRVPLVCKVPLPQSLQRSQRLPFLTTFASGFAIATGCLACFGGAILGVLLVYSGLLGSAALGALAMFLFSLGIAIPFLLAAYSLSWVMPLVLRLHRLAPAIGLASAAVMLFFGLIMVTGNFHVVSGWLYQNLPLG